jgi:hypothetical protein
MPQTEKWKQLCQLAASESDPVRLQELVEQILKILEAKKSSARETGLTEKQRAG